MAIGLYWGSFLDPRFNPAHMISPARVRGCNPRSAYTQRRFLLADMHLFFILRMARAGHSTVASHGAIGAAQESSQSPVQPCPQDIACGGPGVQPPVRIIDKDIFCNPQPTLPTGYRLRGSGVQPPVRIADKDIFCNPGSTQLARYPQGGPKPNQHTRRHSQGLINAHLLSISSLQQ